MYLPPHVLVRFNAFVQCTNAHHYERERERARDKRGGEELIKWLLMYILV